MSRLVHILLVVPLGFILACLAAGAFFVFGIMGAVGEELRSDWNVGGVVFLVLAAAATTGALTFVPAAIVILLAELFGWRSLILHLVLGAAMGTLAGGAVNMADGLGGEVGLALFVAAGAVAGGVYWLVAGRRAGSARGSRAGL